MTDLSYPIGRWQRERRLDPARRAARIGEIAAAPAALRRAVAGLGTEQLDTPYRPGGWTVLQVIHHLPDSHLNAYVRIRLALTEDNPTIRPYDEKRWAELPDARGGEPEISLLLLDALHRRWVTLLESLAPADFTRPLHHPEMGELTVDEIVSLYAWHGRHHVAHVTALRTREGWG
jgi:DinB superfamily